MATLEVSQHPSSPSIFEFALISPGLIPLIHNSSILEPAFLRANKQLRTETLPLFYKRNTFSIIISDFDSSSLLTLYRKTVSLKPRGIQTLPIKFRFAGQPHWPNLREWLERYFRNPGILYVLPPSKTARSQRTANGDVIGTMFATAAVMRKAGLKWRDVEALLPEYREMLKSGDARWG